MDDRTNYKFGGEVVGNSGEFNMLNSLKEEDWENIKINIKKSKL